MSSRTTEFRLLTAASVAAALVPRLARRGLFLDGLTYATIARNLAADRGRFWEPFYTATLYPAFHEHPPLAFWLQSLWFRVLGDHWYVERLYCSAAAVSIALLIAWTWRSAEETVVVRHAQQERRGDPITSEVEGPRDEQSSDWLPVFFWITVPVVSWTIVGNLLETTVSVFTSLAVALIAAGTTTTARRAVLTGALSGAAVSAAVLSKGPVGLFPLAAPLFLTLLRDRIRIAQAALGQWVTAVMCGAVLVAYAPARVSIDRYVHEQLLASLGGQREVSGHPLTMLVALGPGVLLPMAIVATAIAAAAWTMPRPTRHDRRMALAFTLIGLSGSLPMLASPKQSGYYLMPAVAFLAIGAAALARSSAERLMARTQGRMAGRIVVLVAAITAVVSLLAIRVPTFDREPERVAALDRLASSMPRDTIVGICPATNGDWGLHAWFARKFDVSLDPTAARHDWFVGTPRDTPGCAPRGCATVVDANATLVLMRCRPE